MQQKVLEAQNLQNQNAMASTATPAAAEQQHYDCENANKSVGNEETVRNAFSVFYLFI